ncbi:unnamed protein product [Caenorhabditis bovis]|uniref:DNA topoisomerase n=1 Tax=Caenorhabditis bovis TaxID=2654633 RepID=A0A8S1FAU1_9PELO|nr:unnamed protein product [Caenorhabditis bovis]
MSSALRFFRYLRSYPLCPFCYNNPPFENMPEASGCINCPHPSCPNSYNGVGVCGCLQNCGGVMVVDVQSHPKWRLTCNKCASVIALFDRAQKIMIEVARNAERNLFVLSIRRLDRIH